MQKIKINEASAEEIEQLYGVGYVLAKRIIEYREKHGPYFKPGDLARVPGVGVNLANSLSTSIDWSVPVASTSTSATSKERNWYAALLVCPMVLYGFWTLRRLSSHLFTAIGEKSWIDIWHYAVYCFITICASIAILFLGVGSLTTDSSRERRAYRNVFIFASIIVLLYFANGLVWVLHQQLNDPGRWRDLPHSLVAFANLLRIIGFILFCGPLGMILWRPKIIYNRTLTRLFDAALFAMAIGMALTAWIERNETPLIIWIFNGFWGVILAVTGVVSLRTGYSFFDSWRADIIEKDSLQRMTEKIGLADWINTQLPREEDQRVLKEVLVERYPPSRVRSVASWVILTGGGWLVLSALDAIWQQIVVTLWQRFFG